MVLWCDVLEGAADVFGGALSVWRLVTNQQRSYWRHAQSELLSKAPFKKNKAKIDMLALQEIPKKKLEYKVQVTHFWSSEI